jgi:DegV family protein with EDD domain
MAKEIVGEPSMKKVSIGLITDPLANLTDKIVDRYNIEIVRYVYDWPEENMLQGENIYQKMRDAASKGIANLPKTSQPSPKDFLDAFKKKLSQGHKDVLCINFSSRLSGGYNSACQARNLLPEEQKQKIHVFDSLNAAAGQALIVLKAIELIQMQKDVKEILAELKKESDHIKLCGMPQDPKWLEWGGRISHGQAQWLKRLQKIRISPLLGIKDGKIEKTGFSTGAKEMSEAIFKKIITETKKSRKENKNIRTVITHCDNLKEAQKLKEMLRQENFEVSFVNLTDSIIGVHVGPGALIAAWTEID